MVSNVSSPWDLARMAPRTHTIYLERLQERYCSLAGEACWRLLTFRSRTLCFHIEEDANTTKARTVASNFACG